MLKFSDSEIVDMSFDVVTEVREEKNLPFAVPEVRVV